LEKQKDRLILQREKDVCLYVNFFTTALWQYQSLKLLSSSYPPLPTDSCATHDSCLQPLHCPIM
jgi:hypothetical protein